MKRIIYRGAWYSPVADVPPNMEPTQESDPKSLVPDKEKDPSQKEITENEVPEEPKPYDPHILEMKEKLEARLEKLRKKMTLPIKDLKKLIDMYDLPSAQILISDFSVSKERLLKKLEQVVEDLGKL